MGFSVDKVYIDLVTPEGEVLILYLGWARILGFRRPTCGLERYGCDGSRKIQPVQGGTWSLEANELRAELPELGVHYAGTIEHGGWESERPPHPKLSWSVLAARLAGELHIQGETLCGIGYADRVRMQASPRGLGLAEVIWGRSHGGTDTAIINRLTFRDGRVWEHCLRDTAGGKLQIDADRSASDFPLPPQCRTLHEGSALDEDRLPNPWLRGLVRRLTDPQEHRVVAPLEPGWMIRERVTFGASAT